MYFALRKRRNRGEALAENNTEIKRRFRRIGSRIHSEKEKGV